MSLKALRQSFDPVILIISLFNVAFHLAVAGNLEYHRDELLYFSLGMHPAAGYATVPPIIGLSAWLIQTIFGYSIYAVRILPAVLSGIMIIMVARMAKELGGSDYAGLLAAIGFTITGFGLRTFSLFMPVFLDVFFWTLCIYILIRYINSENERYLLWFGIIAGLSLMNKYLIGVMFAGLLIIIPFTHLRQVFRNKMFLVGIAAGFLIFLPNILWQVSRGLPVIKHMSELNRTQLVHVDRLTFLKEQIMNPAWASVLTIEGIIFILIGKRAPKFRFLGFLVLFIILTLMLLRGKSYYTQGLFPFLIAAGAASYDIRLKTKAARYLIPIMIVLLTIPLIPIGIPVMKSPGLVKYFSNIEKKYGLIIGRTFEDNSVHSLPQDYADMLGWGQLTRVADSAWEMIDNKKAAFIYCENYGQAAAITVIGKKYGLPEAVCFSESFRYWFPHKFKPDITSLVYINEREPGQDVKDLFRKITKIGSITDRDAREYGTSVYLCQDPVESFNKFWEERTRNLPWR
jgi:Dolichyl-phosphate-mannose-protein mannosyltransferase